MFLLNFHANNSVILCERNYVLMGMSATQARLLTITGRLTDNEMRSQTITNSKLRLAQKSSDASQEYMDALSSEKLVFKYYNDNGESSTYNLTPALLYSYEPLKTNIQSKTLQGKTSYLQLMQTILKIPAHYQNSWTSTAWLKIQLMLTNIKLIWMIIIKKWMIIIKNWINIMKK